MAAERRSRSDVLLIGFEEGENLGLRYIASYLASNGVRSRVLPYSRDRQESLLALIRRYNPRLVGFSMIFQRLLHEFRDLIAFLRDHGITAHFTMGGHFASIEPHTTLRCIPGLDSVVRGEGEVTTLLLLRNVEKPENWPGIDGLTYRRRGGMRSNPSRRLLQDLDALPFPTRSSVPLDHRGIGIGTLVASRGCYFDCSFCSIHTFYGESPGPRRRSRSPSNVVDEMEALYHDQGARIFVFEDDDFIIRGRRQTDWIAGFCSELKRRRLANRIAFRISCRVDDITAEVVKRLMGVGLTCVYVGIESGNEQGLRTYNKRYSVNDIHHALETLIAVEMPFEFGFMLLNPDCTFDTIEQDIAFLREVGSTGQAVIHFTKMLPYSGTAIERRLKEEGRLAGTLEFPDYSFHDPRIDLYQLFLTHAFHARNFDPSGLVERLRHAKLDVLSVRKFFARRWDADAYATAVRGLIRECNAQCVETLGIGAALMRDSTEEEICRRWALLDRLVGREKQAEYYLTAALDNLMASVGYDARPVRSPEVDPGALVP